MALLAPGVARALDAYEKGEEFFHADDFGAARVAWLPLARQGDIRSIAGLNQLFWLKGGTAAEIAELTAITMREAAKPGAWEAQFELAYLYLRGHGVPRDTEKAMAILEAAAKAGGGDGMAHLGTMHERGAILPRDFALARQWYERAARAGSAPAAWALGDMYVAARGVERDNFLAYKWYYLAGILWPVGERRNEALRAADDVGTSLARDQVAEARRQAQAIKQP